MAIVASAIIASVVGGVATAAIGANAAGNAADAQVSAANHAADLQHQDAQNALDFNKQQYATGQAEIKPWLTNGYGALSNLQYLMGTMQPGNGLTGGPGGLTPQAAAGVPTSLSGTFPPTATSKLMSMRGGVDGLPPGSTVSHFIPGHTLSSANGAFDPSQSGFDPRDNADMPMNGPRFADRGAAPMQDGGAGGDPLALDASAGPATPDVQLPAPNTSLGAAGSLLAPFGEKFQAPDAITEQNDPGFQARLKLGATAMDNSAAARGRVLSGGATRDLDQFAQDYGSNEYGNVYARAFNEYANRYNQFKQQQTDVYNKLAGQAGLGQTTASTMGLMGQNAANTNANINLTSGAQIGQDLNNAGAARASGYIGSANAINNGITGTTSNLMNLAFLSKLFGSSGTSGGGGGYGDVGVTG